MPISMARVYSAREMAAYQLEDSRMSARGGKSARLSALDGSAVIIQTKMPWYVPFAQPILTRMHQPPA